MPSADARLAWEELCAAVAAMQAEAPLRAAASAAERPPSPGRSRDGGRRPTIEVRARAYIRQKDDAVDGAGGSCPTFSAACDLTHGFGLPREVAFTILQEEYNFEPRCRPPWSVSELWKKIDDALAADNHQRPFGHLRDAERRPSTERAGADGRPEIVVSTEQHLVNDRAAAALSAETDLYQMGKVLVAVAETGEPDPDHPPAVVRPVGSTGVHPVHKDLIPGRLTRSARFVQVKAVGNGEVVDVPCHPPPWCAKAVYARGDWPGVRRLEAVVAHPVFLPDGRVLATPGYDPVTGLLLAADAAACGLPDRPTRDDAVQAVAELRDVVCDFPFAAPEHLAAWVAGVLTPLAWWAFDGPAPLFLADGNAPGVGKGKLLHTAAVILTGRGFAVTPYAHDAAETRKTVTALAVQGDRLVMFDNLSGPFGNSALDSAVTAERRWKERVLGASRTYDGPLHVVWYGTGNNVQVVGDTPRRVCQIRIETADERPEERTGFRHPRLIDHVRENRPRLLAAALTILRAWHVAGRPTTKLPEWGSFDGWSGVVRQAVVWAGLADPGEARMSRAEGGDPAAECMATIIAGWRQLDPDGQGLTCGAVVRLLAQPDNAERLGDMRAAMEELCDVSEFSSKIGNKLGYKLRGFNKRIFGGFSMVKVGDTGGSRRWRAKRAEIQATSHVPMSPAARDRDDHDELTWGHQGHIPLRAEIPAAQGTLRDVPMSPVEPAALSNHVPMSPVRGDVPMSPAGEDVLLEAEAFDAHGDAYEDIP